MNNVDSVVGWLGGERDGAGDDPAAIGNHWVSLAEVGRQLGVPAGTVRQYLDSHGAFVEAMRFGKRTLVGRESLPVLEAIGQRYAAGATAAEVDAELTERYGARPPIEATLRRWSAEAGLRRADTAEPARSGHDVGLPMADLPTQLREMQRELRVMQRTIGELRSALERRDETLHDVMGSLVELIVTLDNERRIAEAERDRDNALEHGQTLRSVEELLALARQRRWRR